MELYLKISEISHRTNKLKVGLFGAVIVILLPASLLFWLGKIQLAIIIMALPGILLLLTHPRIILYLFLLLVSLYYPFRLHLFAIHLSDVAALLLIASVAIDFLVRRRTTVLSTRLDSAFLLLIGATFLSGLLAYDKALSIVPAARILMIYMVFRSVYILALDIGWQKLLFFFIGHVFVLSAINVVLFVLSGGTERAFGPAWLAYETYSMTACPMALMFLLLSQTRRERWLWIIVSLTILLGIFSTLSRGPLLTVILAIPVVMIVFRRFRKQSPEYARSHSSLSLVFLAGSVTVVVLLLATTLLTTFIDRIVELAASVTEPQGSIALRMILWKAAFEAFLDHPFVGIGIGNFKLISTFVPSLRLHEHWSRIDSMSSHNVILQYLSETGLFGAGALLLLAWRGVRESLRAMTRFADPRRAGAAGALVIAMAVFSITLFYMRAWSWGQGGHILAILFGLTAAAITDSKSSPYGNHNST